MFEKEPIFINNMSLEYISNELRFHDPDYYKNNTSNVVYRLEDVLRPYGARGMNIWVNSKEMHQYTLARCLELMMNHK